MTFANSITDRFSRSWEITKNTFHVMRKDKEILLFPILGSIFSIILFIIFVLPIFVTSVLPFEYSGIFTYAAIFAFYFIVTFVAVFFNAGIVHIAKTRFEGGDATFKDGLKAATKHLKQIIGWSLLSATVGLILNILSRQAREQKGIAGIIAKIVISLIGLAWAIVSIFVVPAIVIKGLGPIDALKSSARTIKKTWGESLIRHYGLGLVKGIFILVGLLLFLIPALLLGILAGQLAVGLILGGIFVLYVVLVSIIFSSANTIFNTALFLYADSGEVPKFYSKEELEHAFMGKNKSMI